MVLPDAPGTADEVKLALDRPARLPDGITYGPEGDHFGFHLKSPNGDASSYSYIEPGDVELMHDRWLFIRDTKTTGRARRWAPRVAQVKGTQGEASIKLGDRVEVGKWALEWIAVMPGSMGETGVRIFALRSFYDGHASDYWQARNKVGGHRDFSGEEGLSQLEVTISAASMPADATKSALTLRVREVDRAAKGTFGSAIAPGLVAYPGGLRVRFTKGRFCACGPTSSYCGDVFQVNAQVGGKNESFGIPNDGTTQVKLGHRFQVTNEKLVVTK